MFERWGAFLRYLRQLTPREATLARRRITKATLLVGLEWADFERHLLSAESVSKVREAMLARNSSPAALNNTLRDLRGLARVAHEISEVSDEELAEIEAVSDVPDPKPELRLLAGWEISAVISACVREGGVKGARDAALISLTYAGGLSAREVADLVMRDWQTEKDLLTLGSGRTFRGRSIPLGKDSAGLLRRWVALRGSSLRGTVPEPLFLAVDNADRVQNRPLRPPAIGAILNSRAEEARVKRFSHRNLRRTAAADMLAEGARRSEVERILGNPVPEFDPQALAGRRDLAGPKLRAVRLGSEHLDYFDIIGHSNRPGARVAVTGGKLKRFSLPPITAEVPNLARNGTFTSEIWRNREFLAPRCRISGQSSYFRNILGTFRLVFNRYFAPHGSDPGTGPNSRYIPSATPTVEDEELLEWPDPFAGDLSDCIHTPVGMVAFGVIGEGSPVVLVHGTPWSSFCWRRVAPMLADGHSVYAYDLPGHGESEKAEGQDLSLVAQAKALAVMIEEWGIEETVVVGHGVGATIALRAHLLEGVTFCKIVLVDPAVSGSWLSPAGRHIKKYPEAYRSMTPEVFRATLIARLEADTRGSAGRVDLKPYLLPWRSREGRLAYVRMAEQLQEEHAAELEQHLASVKIPLLILAGDTDAAPTASSARHLYQTVPGARLGRIPWACPFLPEETPNRVAHALSRFLA